MVKTYDPGTKFILNVQWTWNGNPNPDFTVKAYSQFSGVNIVDSSSQSQIIHYNGSSPSGFKNSNYTGMTNNCSSFIKSSNNTNITTFNYSPLIEIINATYGSMNVTQKIIDLYNSG